MTNLNVDLTGYTEIQKRIVKTTMNTHINSYEDFITYAEDIARDLFTSYLALNAVDLNDSKTQHMYAKAFTDMLQDDMNDFILYMKEHLND